MENQVIFRDRQEMQATDLNNLQTFVDESLQHFLMDAITAERMFVGLGVIKKSATEITIAAGRLWDGPTGKVFRKDSAEDLSLFSYLPVSDQKYLTLSVIGQTVETDVEPRDFLIDLSSGQTEPRAVAVESSRTVAVLVTAGLESTSPQRPAAPTGYTTVAQVLLSTSGIVTIDLASTNTLMRLFDVWQTALANQLWIESTTPKIASLLSDMANLAARIKSQGTSGIVSRLAAEVALIRDKLSLPATFLEYEADNYLTSAESATTDVEYHALVMMGVRFPWAGETEQQLALFNPYETAIKNFGGLILPDHDLVARLATTGLAGELLLNAYQYQTVTSRQLTRTRVRITYSPVFRYCTNGATWGDQTGQTVVEEVFEGTVPAGVTLGDSQWREQVGSEFTDEGSGHTHGYARNVWRHAWTETYWVVDSTTNSVNGSLNAQTFLNSQNGWLRKVGLTFTKKAATGPVTMLICNTLNGLPNLERVLGSVTVQPGNITTDGETDFEFAQPVFLEPGRRYALVLITGGAHSVALVEGTEYSQGTLFYSTDGEYFQGDFTKDLQMTLYYASFKNLRTVVDLTPVSLAGGIAAFDILHELIQPDATSCVLEYQPSGSGNWYPIQDGTTDNLLGLPAMCRLRAIFNGSTDIMPGLGLTGSKFRAERPGTTFKHISTLRTLSTASADIDVILRLENWKPARHACTVTLLSGGTTYAGVVTDEDLGDDTIRRTVSFSPNGPAGISTYKIVLAGSTTTALDCFHVAQRMDVAK